MTTSGHPKGDFLEDIASSVVDYFSNACGACSLGVGWCDQNDAACAPRDVQEKFVIGKLWQAIEAMHEECEPSKASGVLSEAEISALWAALTPTSEETGE